METVDYESLETLLGTRLKACDNYDLDHEHFFPIGFLDRLSHFAQNLSVVENRHNQNNEVNSFGDDFDRWTDDMVSSTLIRLKDADGNITDCELIEIISLTFGDDSTVTAELADGTTATVVNDNNEPLQAASPDDLAVSISVDYARQSSPLRTLEYLASLFYRAGRSLKLTINNDNRDRFIDPIFNFFKFDMVRLVPDLLEDLEQIYDEKLISLTLTDKKKSLTDC